MSSRIASLSLVLLFACSSEPAVPPSSGPAQAAAPAAAPAPAPAAVDAAGLKAALAAGPARLIDVRTPAEFAEARVPGAVNIPLDELASRLAEVAPDKADDLYVICASGGRSARATEALAAAGFARPINVTGGTNGWKAAGLPTESGPPAAGDAKVE